MVDSTQVILTTVILVLTVMLAVIGLQVVNILKEFKKTVEKVNKVLDDTGTVSESISRPVSMASATLMGIKGGSFIANLLKKKKRKENDV